jgi:hypothetical protein
VLGRAGAGKGRHPSTQCHPRCIRGLDESRCFLKRPGSSSPGCATKCEGFARGNLSNHDQPLVGPDGTRNQAFLLIRKSYSTGRYRTV